MKFKVVHVMHQGDVLFLKLEAAPKELEQRMKTPMQLRHKKDEIDLWIRAQCKTNNKATFGIENEN